MVHRKEIYVQKNLIKESKSMGMHQMTLDIDTLEINGYKVQHQCLVDGANRVFFLELVFDSKKVRMQLYAVRKKTEQKKKTSKRINCKQTNDFRPNFSSSRFTRNIRKFYRTKLHYLVDSLLQFFSFQKIKKRNGNELCWTSKIRIYKEEKKKYNRKYIYILI